MNLLPFSLPPLPPLPLPSFSVPHPPHLNSSSYPHDRCSVYHQPSNQIISQVQLKRMSQMNRIQRSPNLFPFWAMQPKREEGRQEDLTNTRWIATRVVVVLPLGQIHYVCVLFSSLFPSPLLTSYTYSLRPPSYILGEHNSNILIEGHYVLML